MTVNYNGNKITNAYYNGTKLKKIYYNGTLVFSYGTDIWSSADVYLTTGGYIGIRIYDLSGNPMAGNTTEFSITYYLYKDSVSNLNLVTYDTVTDTPNDDTGNITFSTGVTPSYGVSYCAVVEIAEAGNYNEWSGTTESVIVKPYTSITKPSTSYNTTYSGSAYKPLSSTDGYTVTYSSSYDYTNAGTHYATVTLKDGYCWSDETRDDLDVTITITAAYWQATQGSDPLDLEGSGDFGNTIRIRIWDYPNGAAADVTGFTVYYELWNVDKNTVSSETVTVDASSYGNIVIDTGVYPSYGAYAYKNTIVHANGSNFAYTSGLNSNSVTFKSWLGYATAPTASGSGTYGDLFSSFVSGGSNCNLFIEGNVPVTSGMTAPVGTYTLYAAPVAGYRWSGTTGGTEQRYVGTITISKASVALTYFKTGEIGTYNGSIQSAYSANDAFTVSGTASATNAGSYSYTATLKNTTNYQWSDGTTDPKTFEWSIGKYDISANSGNNYKFRLNSDTDKYEWVFNGPVRYNGNNFSCKKLRYDRTTTTKPSSAASDTTVTVTGNSSGNLVNTFTPKSTYCWLDITITPASDNTNFTGSISLTSDRIKVSGLTSSWKTAAESRA